MTSDDFSQSLTAAKPPVGVTLALAGLGWDAKGDWTRATNLLSGKAVEQTRPADDWQGLKDWSAERLQEIMDELLALTEWKKP